jgi:two-component sensor histidine kinase
MKTLAIEDLTRIDFNEHIHNLPCHLMFGYRDHSGMINRFMSIDEMFFNADTANPCDLIINELLSNALQHDFPYNRHGEKGIRFTQDQGECILTITDHGIGFPIDLHLAAALAGPLMGQMMLSQTVGCMFLPSSFTNT